MLIIISDHGGCFKSKNYIGLNLSAYDVHRFSFIDNK